MLSVTSLRLIASMLPKRKFITSVFMPEVTDMTSTPSAREPVDMRAMAASPFMAAELLRRSSNTAATTTTGMATPSSDAPNTDATASAPKPTWDRPSPIMEYRFKTRLTPRSAAQRDTSRPTMSARTMNV